MLTEERTGELKLKIAVMNISRVISACVSFCLSGDEYIDESWRMNTNRCLGEIYCESVDEYTHEFWRMNTLINLGG